MGALGRALLVVVVLAACVAGGTVLWETTVPEGLRLDPVGERAFDARTVERAEELEAVLRVLTLLSIATLVGVLAVFARRGPRLMSESAAGPVGTGFMLGILGIGIASVARLPFGLAQVWWARRYDAIDANYLDWIAGEWGGAVGQAIFLCLALLVAMSLARVLRSAWWAPASVAFAGLAVAFALLSPYLIDVERPSPSIRADAERLSAQERLPDVPVSVEEVHEYTSDPNAYALGLGSTRKVVLWDTLADRFPRREVRVVIAHELAHHEHDHIGKSIGWLVLFIVPAALTVALVARRRGGFGEPEAVPLALLVIVVLNLLASPVQNAASRRYEQEADWTALQASNDPKAMEALFRRFSEEALSDPDPPGWWHAIFETHPSAAERIGMARAYARRR